jgi:arsenite-transporting ATPase
MAARLFSNPVSLAGYHPRCGKSDSVGSVKKYPAVKPGILKLLTPLDGYRRTIFFAGKGGVGKTSVAAATGLWTARRGYKTLLVTTDPASHLAQVFEQPVSSEPAMMYGENNLWVAHIDPPAASREYKERVLAEVRGKYDEKRIQAISEELDSPCTEEMATFEKFIEFATRKDFEVVIFDTAPTGHTLRLLKLPVDWNKQLEIKIFTTAESEADKITKSRFGEVIAMMQDRYRTTFSFVMYPESTPIEEAYRAMDDLKEIGVSTSLVVANLVLPEAVITNDYLRKRRAMQEKYLAEMKSRFNAPIVQLPLMAEDLMGKEKLTEAGKAMFGV